jgi:hypothetical protein
MNKKFFTYYQYIGPIVFTPLSFWLWWSTYNGNITLTLIAWLIPILFAYIVPGVGTNILKVWEFNTKYRLGKFRPHHGFVFGSATSFIAWLCHAHMAMNIQDIFIMSFIFALVLGALNIFYDIKAIKAGILIVYNQPWADGKDAKAITMDYAPIFFAGFGLVYGFGLGVAELLYIKGFMSTQFSIIYIVFLLGISIAIPVVLYRKYSFIKYGHHGCRPIVKNN